MSEFMDILQKVKQGFAYLRTSSKELNIIKWDFYWIVKIGDMQGVAVEIPLNKRVNEQFASVHYFTKEYVLDGQDHHLLLLLSDKKNLYEDFAFICTSFLEKLSDLESYQIIQDNPIYWWHIMKELIGNTNIEKEAYSVIAEMLSYYSLLKQGNQVSWNGPFGGSTDLNTSEGSYEVKSTIVRYGSEITINSQYQLEAKYLLFYRFEPADNGISIQYMLEKLVTMNIPEDKIEQALKKLNYPIGSEIRNKSYQLLQVTRYEIDENFPKITLKDFKGEKLPKHISQLTYTLDLEGLPGESIRFEEFLV